MAVYRALPQRLRMQLGGVYVRSAYMLGAEAPSDDNRWNELQRAPANDLRDRDRGQVTVQIGLDRRALTPGQPG